MLVVIVEILQILLLFVVAVVHLQNKNKYVHNNRTNTKTPSKHTTHLLEINLKSNIVSSFSFFYKIIISLSLKSFILNSMSNNILKSNIWDYKSFNHSEYVCALYDGCLLGIQNRMYTYCVYVCMHVITHTFILRIHFLQRISKLSK